MNTCSNTIDTSSDCSNFVFFGCWNNINCDNVYIYRNIVLDYIDKNETNIKQIYLAGDNWYTNKKTIGDKVFKLYLTDVLRTGYEKLYGLNKEIYIAVGNHDIDTNIKSVSSGASGASGKSKTNSPSYSSPTNADNNNLKKDCNINTQKYYLKQIKDASEINGYLGIDEPTLEGLNYMRDKLNDEALCEQGINIYVDNIGVRYNKDNIIIIINTNNFDNIAKGIAYLSEIEEKIIEVKREQERINQRSKKGIEQIFVMGHIPLFTYRQDKMVKKVQEDKITVHEINKKKNVYKELIASLYDILADNKIIYLCADTHNFSIMRIEHKGKVLIQITAGTGGADPDIIKEDYVIIPKSSTEQISVNGMDGRLQEIKSYTITAYALNSYGYVRMNISKTSIDIFYKQIITDSAKVVPMTRPTTTAFTKKTSKINIIHYHYTLKRNTMDVKYVLKKIEKTSFAKYLKNKSEEICNNITANPKGYITDEANKIICFKKGIEKQVKASSKSSQSPK